MGVTVQRDFAAVILCGGHQRRQSALDIFIMTVTDIDILAALCYDLIFRVIAVKVVVALYAINTFAFRFLAAQFKIPRAVAQKHNRIRLGMLFNRREHSLGSAVRVGKNKYSQSYHAHVCHSM